jgi:hypothetical protein
MIPQLSRLDTGLRTEKWVPYLYVNKNDRTTYLYIHTDGTREKIADVENMDPTKEEQKHIEAHGLK